MNGTLAGFKAIETSDPAGTATFLMRLAVEVRFVPNSHGTGYGAKRGSGTHYAPEWALLLREVFGSGSGDERWALKAFARADEEWRRGALAVYALGGHQALHRHIVARLREARRGIAGGAG